MSIRGKNDVVGHNAAVHKRSGKASKEKEKLEQNWISIE